MKPFFKKEKTNSIPTTQALSNPSGDHVDKKTSEESVPVFTVEKDRIQPPASMIH